MVLRMVGKDRRRHGKSFVCVHTAERSLRLMATGNQLHEHTLVKFLLAHTRVIYGGRCATLAMQNFIKPVPAVAGIDLGRTPGLQ